MALFRSIGARPDETRGTTAAEVRKDLAGLVSGVGILPGTTLPLVEGTDGFAYQVNAGWWATSRGAGDGVHLWGNDGPITVATSVAPGAGLSRIDIIYALHPSADENGDTDSVPIVAVEQGTAASTPIAPTIPTGALELGRNTMTSDATDTAGAGNTISQSATRASLASWPQTNAETLTVHSVSSGAHTGSARLVDHGTIAAATYDRVVEFEAVINITGITTGGTWQGVVTSAGTVVTNNQVLAAQVNYTTSVAVGGSVSLSGSFNLPAGDGTGRPSLWVQELSGSATLNVMGGQFRVRVRPAITR